MGIRVSRLCDGEYWQIEDEDGADVVNAKRLLHERGRRQYDTFKADMSSHLVARPDEVAPKRRPAPPTPVTLPLYSVIPYSYNQTFDVTTATLQSMYVAQYLTKWTPRHHKTVGIEIDNGTYIEDMVPTSYIPPKAWEERPAPDQSEQQQYDTSAPSSETLSNGASIPGHEAYYVRVTELKYDRDDAMNALARRRVAGKTSVRLTQFRKFWYSLDNVSCFWDTSKDGFRPPGAPEPMDLDLKQQNNQLSTHIQDQQNANLSVGAGPSVSGDAPKTKIPGTMTSQPEIKDYYGLRTSDGRSMQNGARAELISSFIEPVINAMGCHYEPHRGPTPISANRAVRVQGGLIRQEVTGVVYRGPRDRALQRACWNEGPVFAVSCRGITNFAVPVSVAAARKNQNWMTLLKDSNTDLFAQLESSNTAVRQEAKSRLEHLGFGVIDYQTKAPNIVRWGTFDIIDASQEVGILLMMAQFRARNAKSDAEPRAGQGKWWVEAERYGGHPSRGVEIGQALFNDDGSPVSDASVIVTDGASEVVKNPDAMQVDGDEEKRGRKETQEPIDPVAALIAVSPSRQISPKPDEKPAKVEQEKSKSKTSKKEDKEHEIWKKKRDLRWAAPKPIWDFKTNYIPVGMGPEQDFDHVYLISSLFHHVSILRLRIHPSMLEFIASPQAARPKPEHWGLFVSRTRWFDLLKPGDRVEALRAVWGVTAYMMRDTTGERPEDRAFARRLSRTGTIAQAALGC